VYGERSTIGSIKDITTQEWQSHVQERARTLGDWSCQQYYVNHLEPFGSFRSLSTLTHLTMDLQVVNPRTVQNAYEHTIHIQDTQA